jgi:hypothetical protein
MTSIAEYRLTDHASLEMKRRNITETEIAQVLSTPEQIETIRLGRAVYQMRFELGQPPKTYLLRVFVDIDRQPPEVVTAYRTSKIDKYWRDE